MPRRWTGAFTGTNRFQLLRLLGEGGHGSVYEAVDLRDRSRVALKVLRCSEPRILLRFKREFRTLIELQHPNLVRLGELFEDEGSWFFTMELVEGGHLLDYVRRETGAPSVGVPGATSVLGPRQEHRLRSALGQLGDVLDALHGAGVLHRDIKPSNIMVRPDGHLVLLDFGVVATLSHGDASTSERIVGTVAYMSPEQASGQPLTPASDLYAVGVVLHEALTGQVPFQGTSVEVLTAKQVQDAPSADWDASSLPPDLVRLCRELLSRDPRDRPDAASLRSRATGVAPAPGPLSREQSRTNAKLVLGRDAELGFLDAALGRARGGEFVPVHVVGESGVGKTSLLRAFADRIARDDPYCICLVGGCRAQERVPYNAFDAAIDALSRAIANLSPGARAHVLPRHAGLLSALFPVLARTSAAFQDAPRAASVDAVSLREHAYQALRELLRRMCEYGQVVLLLDDLHWADAESLALLRALVRPPDRPPVLLVASSWPFDDCSQTIRESLRATLRSALPAVLPLGPLAAEPALALAAQLLEGTRSPERAERIVREAGGHPLFIERLARSPVDTTGEATLERALDAEIAHIGEHARHALHLVAIAEAALTRRTLAHALGVELAAVEAPLSQLLRGKLVRLRQGGSDPSVCLYHARLRSPALSRLGASYVTRCHEQLASALELEDSTDFEALAVHWAASKHFDRARTCFRKAAAIAANALAFSHAAELYENALELAATESEQRELRVELGHALAHAGHSGQAGEVFLTAAYVAPSDQAHELRRLAAHYLLRGGRVDAGLEVARELLQRIGISIPKTRPGMLASALWQRRRLRIRGLQFEERLPSPADAAKAAVCDVLWSIASAIAFIDVVQGTDLHTRSLRLALDLGHPLRVARSLALEGMYGVDGDAVKSRGVLATAESLARRHEHPLTRAYVLLASAVARVHEADVKRAVEEADQAANLLEQQCSDVAWEISIARATALSALIFLGGYQSMRTRFEVALREAEERGNLFAVSTLYAINGPTLATVDDQPDEWEPRIAAAMRQWPVEDSIQHRFALVGFVMLDIYRGGGAGHARMERAWPQLERSFLMRYPRLLIACHFFRGLAALRAMVSGSCPRSRGLAIVEACAKRLSGVSVPDAVGDAYLLRAQALHLTGDLSHACNMYRTATRHYDTYGLYYARITRQRLVGIMGGEEAKIVAVENDAWVRQEGIRRPDRLFAMMAPVGSDVGPS